jgi:hypothetical protein
MHAARARRALHTRTRPGAPGACSAQSVQGHAQKRGPTTKNALAVDASAMHSAASAAAATARDRAEDAMVAAK